MSKHVVMVAAVARNHVIGLDGDIPWSIPEDLKHFRAVTRGHTIIMGRKTFDSIGHPLPFRTNIVVTRDPEWSHDNVFTAGSLAEAVELAAGHTGDTVIMGGAQIYAQALPLATHQILTEVDLAPEGDTFYPEFEAGEWVETRREDHAGDPAYSFVWLERR
ncbi:dihydrofolate reductase [Nocardioides jiangxiensis]|uniref:Dihydrofolate reductase n=1 Tax=Nocardioides jiangxiensis TaxID=3064524 RepID=A0ABT9AY60_9ACTN|nr:dihydrofolate reductase [Nocardioides sp. WY-20]MDO7867000.1 dihydrofolate reductase [Nocardioides sp. WY-20]